MEDNITKKVEGQVMNEVKVDNNGSVLGAAAILVGAAVVGNLAADGVKAVCKIVTNTVTNWYENRKKTKGVIEIKDTNGGV